MSSRWTVVLGGLLAAAVLSGCGSSPAAPTTVDHQPLRPADLYMVHKGSTGEAPRLSAYRIDPTTGALLAAPVTGGVLPLEERVHEMVVGPGNRYVYVATRHSGSAGDASGVRGLVYGFARDAATGGLTALPGSPFGDTRGGDFRSPVVDPSGRFLYVSDPLGEAIDAFAIDASTGALRALPGGNAFPAANNVDGLALAPSGRALYATSSDGSVLAYTVDGAGALAGPQDLLPSGASTAVPVVQPAGRFLYAPNAGGSDVSGYSIDAASGRLVELAGSPFASGRGPVALAFAPGGGFVYALNGQDATVSAFAVDATTGVLSPRGAAVPAGGTTDATGSLAMEPSGRFVYVAALAAATIQAYAVDPVSGGLTAAGAPLGTLPRPAALAVTRATE